MQKGNVARVLRFGSEPGAVVDERPAVPAGSPWLRGFVLGLLLGALLACAYFLWRIETLPVPGREPFPWMKEK